MEKIYVLWRRQLTKFRRSRSRMFGSIFEPLVFLLVLGYGLSDVFEQAGQGDYFDFLAPGVIGQSIIFNSMFAGTEVIWDRQFGLLKDTLVAPVSRVVVAIGRNLGSATVATVRATLVLILAVALGLRPTNWVAVFPAVGVMFLIALIFTGLGTTIASMLKDPQGFQVIMNFLVLPLFLLSGALFPIEGATGALRVFVRLDPLTYGVDALRALLTDAGYYTLASALAVLGAAAVAALWAAGQLFKRVPV